MDALITHLVTLLVTLVAFALFGLIAALVVTGFYAKIREEVAGEMVYLVSKGFEDKNGEVKDGRVPGIPFYIKKSRRFQETAYLETIAACTLKAAIVTKEGDTTTKRPLLHERKTVSLSPDNLSNLKKLQSAVAKLQQVTGDEIIHLWRGIESTFTNLTIFEGKTPDNLPMEYNKVKEETYIDYDNTYYINRTQPFSGSAEIDLELSPEGTLTKAISKVSDNTFETLAGWFSLDSFQLLGGKGAVDAQGFDGKNLFRYEVSLEVEYFYVRHILFKEYPTPAAPAPAAPILVKDISAKPPQVWYRRQVLPGLKPDATPEQAKDPERPQDLEQK